MTVDLVCDEKRYIAGECAGRSRHRHEASSSALAGAARSRRAAGFLRWKLLRRGHRERAHASQVIDALLNCL